MEKEKRQRIAYWVFNIWASFGVLSTAIFQLSKMQAEVDTFTHLGYPLYFLTIIGVWKMLAVAAMLAPGFPLLKEWAYAGLFFTMSGAFISHLVMGDPFKATFPPIFLLILIALSWYLRPPARRITPSSNFSPGWTTTP